MVLKSHLFISKQEVSLAFWLVMTASRRNVCPGSFSAPFFSEAWICDRNINRYYLYSCILSLWIILFCSMSLDKCVVPYIILGLLSIKHLSPSQGFGPSLSSTLLGLLTLPDQLWGILTPYSSRDLGFHVPAHGRWVLLNQRPRTMFG